MIVFDTILVRRGPGRRPLLVQRVRRNARRLRVTARRMRDAGRPAWWIARALGVARGRVDRLLAADPVWGTVLREAAE